MAGVRDPAFWKRFSVAVHMDEEQGQSREDQLKAGDSWLSRQQRKKSRRTWVCFCFWGGFMAFVAALIIVIVWYLHVSDSGAGGI